MGKKRVMFPGGKRLNIMRLVTLLVGPIMSLRRKISVIYN